MLGKIPRHCCVPGYAPAYLHAFLKDPQVRNDVPYCVNVGLFVCLAYFTNDLFVKHSQYVAGNAKILLLKDGTVL